MQQFDSDFVGSDDMDGILQMSIEESQAVPSGSKAVSGPRKLLRERPTSTYLAKQQLNGNLNSLEAEIRGVDDQIAALQRLRVELVREKDIIINELQNTQAVPVNIDAGGKSKAVGGIDYEGKFDWDDALIAEMRKVFKIKEFRLCQRGVCNANMDSRDIVCVMPTGGGKSLTYQLPAIMTPGCTLVISPLISLITDQILHLQEAGVQAVMLTGSTSKEENREVSARFASMARSGPENPQAQDIKLCYVTPEKIARSKQFIALLEKLAQAGKLARIVIDEAHCVSQLGHDFRPDYKKLSILRQLFPHVPILALSATCPPRVLQDLLQILRLKAIVDGKSARPDGTVYFSSPLYRKNLHYQVLPKPSSVSAMIKTMADYILADHPRDSGIIYCLSKKDAENVAADLEKTSGGRIKTGVYHADVQDREKEGLHRRWRRGDVQVVCATIAFGLGIDKGNVRFVLHHSMSKSLDGFYQESGRAGRDGQDADCVLYYRPQDAARLSGIIYGEQEGMQKLHDMLRFAQDMQECRKVQFAKYFTASTSLSITAWSTADTDALARCGHCDNCTRPPSRATHVDVTRDAWRVLRIADAVHRTGGRATLSMLADLARGRGGLTVATSGQKGRGKGTGKGKGKVKGEEGVVLDLEEVSGQKVDMSKDDTETLVMELLLGRYLEETFTMTAYAVNVYLKPGPIAVRMTRLSKEEVDAGRAPNIMCWFRQGKGKGSQKSKGKSKRADDGDAEFDGGDSAAKKRKRRVAVSESEEEVGGDGDDDEFVVQNDVGRKGQARVVQVDDSEPEGSVIKEWSYSLRSAPSKKQRINSIRIESSRTQDRDIEVLELSSD